MKKSTHAIVEFFIDWQSLDARHREWRYFPKVDFWRDFMPEALMQQLSGNETGKLFTVEIESDHHLTEFSKSLIRKVPTAAIEAAFHARKLKGPYPGRFYPKGFLAGIRNLNDIYAGNMTPFRVLDIESENTLVDLNHPLAGKKIILGGRVTGFLEPREQHGGVCNDIVTNLAERGPGMQALSPHGPTAFIHEGSYRRVDESDDGRFYSQTRMVDHLDRQACMHVNRLYREQAGKGMKILDLMSSHNSHLEGLSTDIHVTGLGMNEAELKANPALQHHDLWNLNANPTLPYEDNSFDHVICTVSVEYLVRPIEVFRQVARVLKPGGKFMLTFSDRWFPAKVIELWTELHPFERMGLVLEYLRQSGGFREYYTESLRGWPRPEDDPHIDQRHESDPLFFVMAEKT